jgi:hypothetical protein
VSGLGSNPQPPPAPNPTSTSCSPTPSPFLPLLLRLPTPSAQPSKYLATGRRVDPTLSMSGKHPQTRLLGPRGSGLSSRSPRSLTPHSRFRLAQNESAPVTVDILLSFPQPGGGNKTFLMVANETVTAEASDTMGPLSSERLSLQVLPGS